MRRFVVCWQMFADDNQTRLAPNGDTPNHWVDGWLDYSTSSDNTNLNYITGSKLYPYDKAVDIYRCPDDLSTYLGTQLRVRSYSMNSWIGEAATGWGGGGTFQIQTNLSQVRHA